MGARGSRADLPRDRLLPKKLSSDAEQEHRSRTRRALAFMLMSALSLSAMAAIVKSLGGRLPTAELLLARTVVSLALSYIWLRRLQLPVLGTDRKRLLLRGVFGFFGLGCMFYALPRMPLAEATVIQYLYPLFTAALAFFVLKEALRKHFWTGTVIALLGVVLVAQPGMLLGVASTLPVDGLLAALGSAWFSACAYVLVRRLSQTEHPLVIVFYFPLVATPLTVPFVLLDFVMPTGWEWVWLLLIGVTTQIGQVCLTRGLQLVEAGRGTSMAYAQVVFAALWGLLLFDEWPSTWTLLGAACIVLGTWVVQR